MSDDTDAIAKTLKRLTADLGEKTNFIDFTWRYDMMHVDMKATVKPYGVFQVEFYVTFDRSFFERSTYAALVGYIENELRGELLGIYGL